MSIGRLDAQKRCPVAKNETCIHGRDVSYDRLLEAFGKCDQCAAEKRERRNTDHNWNFRDSQVCPHGKIIYNGWAFFFCAQCSVPSQAPAPVAPEEFQKESNAPGIFQIENYCNNAEVASACISYGRWYDPKHPEKNIKGKTVVQVLRGLAHYARRPEGSYVYPGNERLARETGVSENYVGVCKRALAFAGVIEFRGMRPYPENTEVYWISLDHLKNMVYWLTLPVPQVLVDFYKQNPDPEKLAAEDAAEEEYINACEEAWGSGDMSEGIDEGCDSVVSEEGWSGCHYEIKCAHCGGSADKSGEIVHEWDCAAPSLLTAPPLEKTVGAWDQRPE
jgi:hypothetical protein